MKQAPAVTNDAMVTRSNKIPAIDKHLPEEEPWVWGNEICFFGAGHDFEYKVGVLMTTGEYASACGVCSGWNGFIFID